MSTASQSIPTRVTINLPEWPEDMGSYDLRGIFPYKFTKTMEQEGSHISLEGSFVVGQLTGVIAERFKSLYMNNDGTLSLTVKDWNRKMKEAAEEMLCHSSNTLIIEVKMTPYDESTTSVLFEEFRAKMVPIIPPPYVEHIDGPNDDSPAH